MKNKHLQFIDPSQKLAKCRPLGTSEKIFWLSEQSGRAHLAITAKIKGEFSVEQLKQALAQVQHRHLLLRVRIALDEAQHPWFVEDTANIPLRVTPRKGEQHWQRELEQEYMQPFVSGQAPLVRVVLIHSTDVSELIITSHHCISDGISKLFLIRDILQALAAREPLSQSLPIIPAMEDLIPGKVDENLLSPNSIPQKTSWRQKSSLSTKLVDPPTLVSTATGQQIWSSQTLPHICFGSLSSEKTTLLISRCRQEQTTVHGAICAAFLLEIANQNLLEKQQDVQCFSAINIREYLRPVVEEQFGCYATGKTTLQSLTPNTTLWEVARSLKDQLTQEVAPGKVFEDILRSQEWISTNPDFIQIQQVISEALGHGVIVSNLGSTTFSPQFGHLQLQAIYGPIGSPPGENQGFVGSVTVGKQLFLTLVLPTSTMSLVEGKDLLGEAIHLLQD